MEQSNDSETDSVGLSIPFKEGEQKRKPFYVTNMFFQRTLSIRQKYLLLFFNNVVYGCAYGYYFSVQTRLQEEGASFKQQAALSVAFYPFSFKFIIAPFLDRFYSYKLGRSKTYVLLGSCLNCFVFYMLSSRVENYLDNKDVATLMISLFIVTCVVCMIEIATDCWTLTLFDNDEQRSKSATYQNLGNMIGTLLSFNIFIPLNDVQWLNQNIFKKKPIGNPLVSHQEVCIFISVLYAIQFILMLFFVAEEIYINPDEEVTFSQVLKVFPRHFTNKNMFKFILYMFSCRFFYYMVDQIFDLKMMANGYHNVRRSYVNNLDTAYSPISVILSYLTVYYLVPGRLIRIFHSIMIVICIHGFFRYLTIMDLIINRNGSRAIVARGLSTMVIAMDYSAYFLYSYFFHITNPKIGNTGMCCLVAFMYQTSFLAQTAGFYLVDIFPFETMVPISLGIQAFLLIILYRFPNTLDKIDPGLFDLATDAPKESKENSVSTRSRSETLQSKNTSTQSSLHRGE